MRTRSSTSAARRRRIRAACTALLAVALSLAHSRADARTEPPKPVTWDEISKLPKPPFDDRIAYGDDSLQFGELRLPKGKGPFPVAIVIHGGCWHSEYDLDHATPLAGTLTAHGIATWTIEYRRIGNPGAGWPGTFEDVARAADVLRDIAKTRPLDLGRVIAIGHSAGGQLALWLAARRQLPAGTPGASRDALPIRGVVGLAAISDLATYARGSSWCMKAAPELMGGSPDSLRERYELADPSQRLPLGVPVRLVHGADDKIVPFEQSTTYAARAKPVRDDVKVLRIEGAGHFDVVAPSGKAHEQAMRAVEELLHSR